MRNRRGGPKVTPFPIKNVISAGNFFRQPSVLNLCQKFIKGSICVIKVELIEDTLMKEIRCLDKLLKRKK